MGLDSGGFFFLERRRRWKWPSFSGTGGHNTKGHGHSAVSLSLQWPLQEESFDDGQVRMFHWTFLWGAAFQVHPLL